MLTTLVQPTGRERFFCEDEVIVSKTDLRGVITYANRVFLRVAGYREAEVLGQPHNIVRHPHMPRCVFKLLWDVLHEEREIFAYVLNMAKNGDHYWVFAHVTPSRDMQGKVVGYHSNRRLPSAQALNKVQPLYRALLQEEERHSDWRDGMQASEALLLAQLEKLGVTYDQFVFSL